MSSLPNKRYQKRGNDEFDFGSEMCTKLVYQNRFHNCFRGARPPVLFAVCFFLCVRVNFPLVRLPSAIDLLRVGLLFLNNFPNLCNCFGVSSVGIKELHLHVLYNSQNS